MVRTRCFHCCGLGSVPGQGTEIPQAMGHFPPKKRECVLGSRWEAEVRAFVLMGMLGVGVREWWVTQDAESREEGLDIEDLKADQRLEGARS